MRHRLNNSLFGKTALAAVALAGFLMFTGVTPLRADRDNCAEVPKDIRCVDAGEIGAACRGHDRSLWASAPAENDWWR